MAKDNFDLEALFQAPKTVKTTPAPIKTEVVEEIKSADNVPEASVKRGLYIKSSVWERLEQYAKRNDKKYTAVITTAIIEYLDRHDG